MSGEAVFSEASAEPRIESVPYAHLSIELGHLYMEDLQRGEAHLRRQFQQVAPWAAAARQSCVDSLDGRTARISTCFLVDDYFTRLTAPDIVIPQLLAAADSAGLRIDYLARESACAQADGIAPARQVAQRLVAEPSPNTNGSRPPPAETGWLSNGVPSTSDGTVDAMGAVRRWTPPRQTVAKRHSIYVDVQLWDDTAGTRTWSCPFLAAVWQLVRLGMLRHDGKPVLRPRDWDGSCPADWDRLPAVLRLHPAAESFSAYRTLSVLAGRFLPIEHAVRTILSQVAVDVVVARQAVDRSAAEGIELPPELVDRIEYVFTGATAAWR